MLGLRISIFRKLHIYPPALLGGSVILFYWFFYLALWLLYTILYVTKFSTN